MILLALLHWLPDVARRMVMTRMASSDRATATVEAQSGPDAGQKEEPACELETVN